MTELTRLGDLLFTQSKKGYRHNIDSVLLANYVNLKNKLNILDVGSGDGIIPILLERIASQFNISITGIELQQNLYNLSLINALQNNSKVNFINSDFFHFNFDRNFFDIIITNPPYFPKCDGQFASSEEKNLAKHEITFTLKDFLNHSKKILKYEGSIYFIYPINRILNCLNCIFETKFSIKNMRFIHNSIDEEASLVLFEITLKPLKNFKISKPLIIYSEKEQRIYTPEVQKYLFMEKR